MQIALTYDDVLLIPQYSEVRSRKDVSTKVRIKNLELEVPITCSNMSSVISEKMCINLSTFGGIATIDQFRTIEEEARLVAKIKKKNCKVAAACGVTKDFKERAMALVKSGVDILVFDTPHADSLNAVEAVVWCRKKHPKLNIVCGNLATAKGARRIFQAGADGVKVGVGPGAACLTRVNAGVGYPQFEAVRECSEVARKMGGYIIADGGVSNSGNFAKAIGAGASLVMMGSVFAGAEESPGKLIIENGKKFKEYFGSTSVEGRTRRVKKDTRHQGVPTEFVEGAAGLVPYRGTVEEILAQYSMGLKSAMSYSNSRKIGDFWQKARFVQITSIGLGESGAHGIIKK